jgi:hypothetical protein
MSLVALSVLVSLVVIVVGGLSLFLHSGRHW